MAVRSAKMHQERQEIIIDATIKIVVERGLEKFSLIQVAQKLNMNETLIYREFPTKEILLEACFEHINKELEDLLETMDLEPTENYDENVSKMKLIFSKYYEFMKSNGERTVFHLTYRNSKYLEHKNSKIKERRSFGLFKRLLSATAPTALSDEELVVAWVILIDGVDYLSRRVINGDIDDNPETEKIGLEMILGGLKYWADKKANN